MGHYTEGRHWDESIQAWVFDEDSDDSVNNDAMKEMFGDEADYLDEDMGDK